MMWEGIIDSNVRSLIVLAIIQAGKNGISGKELERKSGVSRTTICKQRDRLKNDGLAYYETKGKRTTYYPTQSAMDNSFYRSWVRYDQLFRLLESRPIPINSPFYDIKFPNYFDYRLERSLLGFALGIGILVTDILLQHLGPNKVKEQKHTQNRNATIIANKLTEKSVRDIISPVKMLTILRQSLYQLGYKFPISTTTKLHGYSFYEMESGSHDEVIRIFNSIFPEAVKMLRTINFDNEEACIKRRVEDARRRREQRECKHNFQTKLTDKTESYRCSICDSTSKIDRHTIIDSKEIIQKLNSVKPPTDTCRNHRWKVYSEIMPFVSFECQLCRKVAKIPIESQEKLDAIREEVEIEDSLDPKSSVGICEDIEMFFHRNSNRRLTVDHYIKYYEKHHFTRKIVDRRKFMNEVETICGVLARNDYIECVNANSVTSRSRIYIRRENKVKSVTGKKLLTLAIHLAP